VWVCLWVGGWRLGKVVVAVTPPTQDRISSCSICCYSHGSSPCPQDNLLSPVRAHQSLFQMLNLLLPNPPCHARIISMGTYHNPTAAAQPAPTSPPLAQSAAAHT
jgi:hypothetical protein